MTETSEIRVIARLDGTLELWHWLWLHEAHEQRPYVYHVHGGADSVCGVLVGEGQMSLDFTADKDDAPDEPTCPGCRTMGLSPAFYAAVRDALEVEEPVTAEALLAEATIHPGGLVTWERALTPDEVRAIMGAGPYALFNVDTGRTPDL